jgi:hypothetical protein
MDRESFHSRPVSKGDGRTGRVVKVLAFCACAMSLSALPAHANLDGTVLRDALYAAATDKATITWPAGVYSLGEDPGAPGFVFSLSVTDPSGTDPRRSRTNLTIDATGVTLVVTSPDVGVFRFRRCNGLIIKNLTIDYDPLPWNQSTITAVDLVNHTFDVTLEPGYLPFSDPAFNAPNFRKATLFDPATKLVRRGTNHSIMNIDSATSLGGASYRLHVDQNRSNTQILNTLLSYFQINDRFVQTVVGGITFDIADMEPTASNSVPFELNGITCYAASDHFLAVSTSPMFSATAQPKIVNCQLTKPNPDGGRLIAGCGVGLLASGNRKGIYMDKCTIECNMDDGMSLNVHARLFKRYPNESSGNYRIAEFSAGPPWRKGDVVQLFDPATGAVGSFTIDSVVPENAFADVTVQFTAQAPGMYSDSPTKPTIDNSYHAYDVNMANPDFAISGSTFGKNRGSGAVLMWKGKFTGNTVNSTWSYGVAVSNPYTMFASGPVPSNVVIRNNTFNSCGNPYQYAPALEGSTILAMGQKKPGTYTPADYVTVTKCSIEANTINGWVTHGIHLQSAKNCSVVQGKGAGSHDQLFTGSVDTADRAIYIAFPTSGGTADGVDTTQILGWSGYAVTIEHGVDRKFTARNIFVVSPTLKLEDFR